MKALITDMNQVIGHAAGHSLEIQETIDYLKSESDDANLHELVLNLSAELLLVGHLAADINDAKEQVNQVLDNGSAAEKFAQMVAVHGGPKDLLEQPQKYLASAAFIEPVFAGQAGFVEAINCRGIGLSIIDLGGGRTKASDVIDPAVGYSQVLKTGQKVDAKTPIAMVHASSQDALNLAKKKLRACYQIGNSKPKPTSVIIDQL